MQEIFHSISIERKKTVTVTGVESVKAFSGTKIELNLSGNGQVLLITGSDLKITGFTKTTETFVAVGKIDGVKYLTSLREKIFK